MKALLAGLQLVKLLLTGSTPTDSQTQYVRSLLKEYIKEDILLGIGASLVGIVMALVTILTIFVLTISLWRLLSGYW